MAKIKSNSRNLDRVVEEAVSPWVHYISQEKANKKRLRGLAFVEGTFEKVDGRHSFPISEVESIIKEARLHSVKGYNFSTWRNNGKAGFKVTLLY